VTKIKRLLLVILGTVTLTLPLSAAAIAVSEPVEFVVPDTTLTVSGLASPGALVTIYDANTIIGTTLADGNARFTKEFVALEPGLINLRLEFIDKSGRKSNIVTDTVSLAFHKQTAVEYFLPPTLGIDPIKVAQGDQVVFFGSSVPNSQLSIVIDGGNTVLRPQTDSNGNYSVSLATDGYFLGQHPISSTSKYAGKSSYETGKLTFEVVPPTFGATVIENQNSLNPPIIVSPTSPHSSDNQDITVSGTAPPNQQIIIFVDGEPVGSTFSNAKGEWFFNIKLYNINQEIKAITCIDSECSDYSNTLKVEFTGVFGKCSELKFALADYRFWGINPGSGVDLEMSQFNGSGSYEMVLDWGDGVVERFDHTNNNVLTIQHIYRESGQFNGSVTIKDKDDCLLTKNFSVSVNPRKLEAVDMWWLMPAAMVFGFASLVRYKEQD
jgi:hypothetical protein